MPFKIIRNDITKVRADAIVNTANPHPVIGSGTDSAVYKAAGERELLAERVTIGDIAPGAAAYTPAFKLNAKYIIHTVGPSWVDGNYGEREILRSCYKNCLALAGELKAESIAFPLIATGVYGFPKDEALDIALAEIGKFLLTHDMQVILVVFDKRAFELSSELVGKIDEFIDENAVAASNESEYAMLRQRRRRLEETAEMPVESLDDAIGSAGETFQQRLFMLIDESGMDDVTVYKKANIDRKVFSRIRCKPDYKPTKKTAVAFAIALGLDMPTMLDLLARAGIAFSPSDKFDLIVEYFVRNGNYNIFEINAALFDYGQPTLGK